MKGDARVINRLNEVLAHELTSINRHFADARLCEDRGYERLWKRLSHQSIGEMKHADELIERVMHLEGVPSVERLGRVDLADSIKKQFELDLGVEKNAVKILRDSIKLCKSLGDDDSGGILESILADEEGHAHWLEAQLELIEASGEADYLAKQF